MHTHNVNVKTATEESSRKMGEKDTPLTDAQIIEIFNWVFEVTADMPGAQCHDFTPPDDAEEFYVLEKGIPDYCSIWIRNKWPVAAALPLDSLFRVLPD